jgi:hypothetical protein
MSKMRKLLESLDDIIDGEPVGVDKPSMAKPKSSTKFLGKPYKRGEDEQEVTETDDEDAEDKDLKESLKAQFEDYVKNKAVPDSKKELKLEKQDDGSYQVKNEKGSVVCRGTKSDCQTHITKKNAELNDAKLEEAAKWRQGYSASGHPAGYKHKNGEVGPLGGTFTNEPSGYDGETTKVPVQKHRDQEDQLNGRDLTKLSAGGKPLLQKNANKNLKAAIIQSKGKHGPVGKLPESAPSSKSEKMAKLKAILDKVSAELKNTRKKIGDNKKVTEAPIDQQVPTAAGNTVQAAPGVVQAAGQAQQAPANQQGAVPANQAQQQPKPAPGQPQTTAQQAPAQPGQQTVAPAPGQPTPPATGQAGGAPVAQPPGTPAPAQGSAVNAATTPGEQVKGLVQTLASNPGAAKQLGTKLNTVMK